MAPFDYDQAWAANFAYRIIHEYPIQFIGQGLSVEGLFMGPIGFYLLTPFYLLTNLHPLGGSIGAVFFGLLIIASYFFVGKELISKEAGLVAAFIRTITYLEISNDLNPAPLTISELLVIWLWWAFYKYWHGQKKALILIAIILGLFTSMHPVHLPFYLVVPIFLIAKRSWPGFKNILLSVIGFFIAISPLLIFQFLHNFLEAKRFIDLFTKPSGEPKTIANLIHWAQFNLEEISRVLTIDIAHKEYIGLLVLIIFSILVWKRVGFWKDKFHASVSILVIAIFLIYYGLLLPKNVTEYYFLALRVLVILYVGASLSLLIMKKNYITTTLLGLILIYLTIVNFSSLQKEWDNPSKVSLYHKDFIVSEIIKRQPQNQVFYVSYISNLGWNFGFDYLFKYYGKIPQTIEAKPPIYTTVIPKSLSAGSLDIVSGNIGLILPK